MGCKLKDGEFHMFYIIESMGKKKGFRIFSQKIIDNGNSLKSENDPTLIDVDYDKGAEFWLNVLKLKIPENQDKVSQRCIVQWKPKSLKSKLGYNAIATRVFTEKEQLSNDSKLIFKDLDSIGRVRYPIKGLALQAGNFLNIWKGEGFYTENDGDTGIYAQLLDKNSNYINKDFHVTDLHLSTDLKKNTKQTSHRFKYPSISAVELTQEKVLLFWSSQKSTSLFYFDSPKFYGKIIEIKNYSIDLTDSTLIFLAINVFLIMMINILGFVGLYCKKAEKLLINIRYFLMKAFCIRKIKSCLEDRKEAKLEIAGIEKSSRRNQLKKFVSNLFSAKKNGVIEKVSNNTESSTGSLHGNKKKFSEPDSMADKTVMIKIDSDQKDEHLNDISIEL